ncbi:UPF0271 protein [Tumebacillus sp. BK434]|uniref:LamB/YcsF family protein n=1 Tax=Tumebacillus sp. BK434 TaxID=2512169 RepID=UPI001051546C|nr:5-oxoprolinase subunit PxpA [Tumebacillus sp. BK434]TCP57603.1 UPF0271 protein [Tumebacillus sp. BK434]
MLSLRVDLNCDMGESFGAYELGRDEEILAYVTSANIACGFHAGDPSVMRKTVQMALEKGVAIGAHPGLPDLVGFGRRNMAISPQEAYDLTVYQIGALQAFVQAAGGTLQHVKPHGALYNMAAQDAGLSLAIAEAVYRVDPALILYGLSGSQLVLAGEQIGLRTAHEIFADRTYQPDGTLTPRTAPGALIDDPATAAAQVIRMVRDGTVRADTVCIHGDGHHALAFAGEIRKQLQEQNIVVTAAGKAL